MPLGLPIEVCDPSTGVCNYAFGSPGPVGGVTGYPWVVTDLIQFLGTTAGAAANTVSDSIVTLLDKTHDGNPFSSDAPVTPIITDADRALVASYYKLYLRRGENGFLPLPSQADIEFWANHLATDRAQTGSQDRAVVNLQRGFLDSDEYKKIGAASVAPVVTQTPATTTPQSISPLLLLGIGAIAIFAFSK